MLRRRRTRRSAQPLGAGPPSMAVVYQNYPHGLDDQALQNAVNSYIQAIYDARANINVVLQYSPLLQLGQSEPQRRIADRNAATARRLTYVSLGGAGLALVLTVLATLSSARWETAQLAAIAEMNARLEKLVAEQTREVEMLTKVPSEVGAEVAKHLPVPPPPAPNKSLERTRDR
jgi:hypothetical protein